MTDRTPNDTMKLVTDEPSDAGAARDGQGPGRGRRDIERLGTRIRHLHHSLRDLASGKDFEALIGLVRQPGYGTAVEFEMVAGLVEVMHEQVNSLAGLKQLVTTASYSIVGR